MNKNYLKYLFNNKKSQCIAIVVFYVLGIVLSFTLQYGDNALVNIVIASIIMAIAAFALVPITYGYVHNKKAVDTYFSLPITRKEMLITSQIYIDLLVLVPFLVSTTVSLIIGRFANNNLGAYLLFILVAIVAVIIFVAFETAIFLQANTTFDGVVMMFAYLIIPLVLLILITSFTEEYITGVEPINVEQLISYISLPIAVGGNEIYFAECFSGICTDCDLFNHLFVILIINLIVHGIIAIYALKKSYIERKVERAETISNSFFSYPFVMYAYTFMIIMSIALAMISDNRGALNIESEWVVFLFVMLALFLIANFVYRRKIRIYIKDIIFFIITVVISISFASVAYNTKGFGLSYKYDHSPKNIAFEYQCYYEIDELNEVLPEYYESEEEICNGVIVYGFISQEEMDSKKDLVNFVDKERQESIDSYYDYRDWAYLVIRTNYDQKDYNNRDILYEDSKDLGRYVRANKIPLKELLKYKDDLNISVEIYDDQLGIEYIDINDLLTKTQSK